ncbi:MAG: translation initiation factor IF-3 [Clostridia bacterium]
MSRSNGKEERKKKQKVIDIKEVRLSPNIEEHDLQTKLKNAVKFLKNGDKVKVVLSVFAGVNCPGTEIGCEVLDDFTKGIAEVGDVEKPRRWRGEAWSCVLMPKH